jgi:hypothetical protein
MASFRAASGTVGHLGSAYSGPVDEVVGWLGDVAAARLRAESLVGAGSSVNAIAEPLGSQPDHARESPLAGFSSTEAPQSRPLRAGIVVEVTLDEIHASVVAFLDQYVARGAAQEVFDLRERLISDRETGALLDAQMPRSKPSEREAFDGMRALFQLERDRRQDDSAHTGGPGLTDLLADTQWGWVRNERHETLDPAQWYDWLSTVDRVTGGSRIVYVELLEEGVDVWRPVLASADANGVYRLTDENSGDEKWQFAPGSRVRCAWRELSDEYVLMALEGVG